jgi:arginyl-tRNA synthetase
MPTILQQLESTFAAAIRSAFGFDADPMVSVAQNESFGDYQSNAAMGLAKRVSESTGTKTNPRAVAENVKSHLKLPDAAAVVSIAGPGFINIKFSPAWMSSQVDRIAASDRLGVDPVEKPQTVVVDYSGINIAKQMHVGHLRSTIIGDAIARVLGFRGDNVIRQNHLGDWGTQFGMLIAYLKQTQTGADARIADLDAFYKKSRATFDTDPQFADEARATVVRLQASAEAESAVWATILSESRRHYQPIYGRLGVLLVPEDERGESFYNPMLPAVVSDLKASAVAAVSEGAVVVFTPGVEAPLIIEKSNGGCGYATTDLAALRYRVSTLHADRIIYFVGATQSQHFKQVFAAARAAGWAGNAVIEHAAFGSILGPDGKIFKTRSGETVKLVDLLDEADERGYALAKSKDDERVARATEKGEPVAPLPADDLRRIGHAVGVGAIKYGDLSKDRIGDYVFSWDSMLAMDGNTAPYLQYAYARIQSIFRRAADRGIVHSTVPVNLDAPAELALARHLLRFADVIDAVARELKPHLLCTYLFELATRFSGFFENCPVIQSEDPVRSSRLTLCRVTGRTIGLGLELLGIEHPDQM